MFRKLAGLAGMVLRTDFRPLLATVAIGYGIAQLQGYAKDQQRRLAHLDALIAEAEARFAGFPEPPVDAPYPAPEDLNPLGTGSVEDLAASLA